MKKTGLEENGRFMIMNNELYIYTQQMIVIRIFNVLKSKVILLETIRSQLSSKTIESIVIVGNVNLCRKFNLFEIVYI